MKNSVILLLFLTTNTVFASCPIDSIGSACTADLLQNSIPQIGTNSPTFNNKLDTRTKDFIGTPSAETSINAVENPTSSRTFGPTSQNYGYNATCQFGICRDTGTPKNFSESD